MKKFLVTIRKYDGTSWNHYDYEKIVEAETEEEARAKCTGDDGCCDTWRPVFIHEINE